MAEKQSTDLSITDFVFGPFVAFQNGEDVIFKCVKLEEVPAAKKLEWIKSIGDISLEAKNSEFLEAFALAKYKPAYSRYARFSAKGTVLAPYMTYGPFVIVLNDRGETMFKVVPVPEMIPEHVKNRWAMISLNSDLKKVDEWIQAINAVAAGKSPQFCRWSPLRGSGDVSFWKVVSK